MSEEDIKRIEKKVDLLFKILLELNIYEVGYPYKQEYINNFIDELIPLFELSAEKEKIKTKIPTQEEIKGLANDYIKELEQLEKKYEKGDYLAKEENEITTKIGDLKKHINDLPKILHSCVRIEEIHQQIYEIHLFWDLRKKLRLNKEQGYESLTISNLKNELKDLLEIWKENG